MPGYLLDSNHVSKLFEQHPKVIERVKQLPNAQLLTSAITLGEIEAGHQMTDSACTNRDRRNEYVAWVNKTFLPHVYPVDDRTRTYYAQIIGRLWEANPPKHKRVKTERHLVVEIGVDINDVWISAVALEHGLTLVTSDGMDKVRAIVQKLGLQIENWTV